MSSIQQRFQSLKNYINTELRGIRAAFPRETEHVANEIDSLATYIKDNLKYNDSVAETALVGRVASNRQDTNTYKEPAIATADNVSDNCRSSGKCVAQNKDSAASVLGGNATSGHSDNESGQSEESLAQTLSLICDEILAIEKQNTVMSTNGPASSTYSEREGMEEELMGQNIRDQDEGGAASADGALEERESEHESEEEPQAQSSDKATRSEHIRRWNSVSHAQPSTASAPAGKLKRNRAANSTGGSSNKRQRRSIAADVEDFKRKDISAFFKQTALIPKDFHQPEEIYGTFSERCTTDDPATIWLLTRLFFGTGSPNSFDQLSKICTTLRQNQNLPIPQATNSLRQVVQALDSLDVQFSVASVLRRYFLVSLKSHRMKLEEEHQHSPSVRTRKSQTVSTLDRADTQALRKMMEEAYPDLQSTRRVRGGAVDDYQRKLTALNQRIRGGRNWKILQEKFGPSILLLIPSRDECNIRDSDIEKLSIPVLRTLIEVLSEYRGAFLEAICGKVSQIATAIEDQNGLDRRYKFEKIAGASLKKEPPDSSRFIEYCELDTDDPPKSLAKPNDGPQESTTVSTEEG